MGTFTVARSSYPPPPLPSWFNVSSDFNILSTVIQNASSYLQQAPALLKKGAFCLPFAFSCVSDGCLISSESEEVSPLTDVKKEDICFLRDQASLPYLPWEDDFSNKEIAKYLLNPPSFAICKDRPAVCQRNALFVIDREVLASDDDLKCDDFSWRNNGTKPVNVSLGSQTYVLNRTYFLHRKYKDFKRRIHTITMPDGTEGRYVMVVYRLAKEEHPVTPNKKAWMQPSTIAAMKKKLNTGKSSHDVFMEARQEVGGLSATNVSTRPRTINQVQKLKGRSTVNQTSMARSGQKDELYSVIVKCIEDSSNPDRFIQFVQGASQPLAFLADARQLSAVERFCTNSRKPVILSIDTTYNCREFYVTPTMYQHQLLNFFFIAHFRISQVP
ncbi:hypothetical protein ACROYT_G014759 [Oculina patagonica]